MGRKQKSNQATLRAHSDFERVFGEGKRFFRDGLGFCVRKTDDIAFRFAISVPKRFGKAVLRNKLRRRIKEIIRISDTLPASVDMIVCVRKQCCKLSFDSLKGLCEWVFAKIGRINPPVTSALDYGK